jgi:hypothetical protein
MNPESLQKTIMLGARNRDDHATPNPLEDYTVSIVTEFLTSPAKRLLQHYLPTTDLTLSQNLVGYRSVHQSRILQFTGAAPTLPRASS